MHTYRDSYNVHIPSVASDWTDLWLLLGPLHRASCCSLKALVCCGQDHAEGVLSCQVGESQSHEIQARLLWGLAVHLEAA